MNWRNFDYIDYCPHLLLQGDFFLTSRCYPPESTRVLKLSLTQREALAPQKRMAFLATKTKKLRNFCYRLGGLNLPSYYGTGIFDA